MYTAHQFWTWFEKHQLAYTFLDAVDPAVREELLNNLQDELHHYCDELYFEVGGMPDEEQELIITAEGKTDYFGKVEELIGSAPVIDGWIFIAFKPPTEEHFISSWKDLEMSTENIWFIPLESNDHPSALGIRVLIKGYSELEKNDHLQTFLHKLIDTVAGERAAALDIGYLDFVQLQGESEEERIPITQLSHYIQWFKSR